MSTDRINMLNIAFDNISTEELLASLSDGFVMPINVDVLITLQQDRELYDISRKAEYVVVDSQVIANLLRFFMHTPVKQKTSGSDFFPAFCAYHRKNPDIRIFLLGGQDDAAASAQARINAELGRNIIVDCCSPSMGFDMKPDECDAIVEQINESAASVLAVGVGAPKQEKWIARYRDRLSGVRIFMAVGATVDFQAGRIKRAPKWMADIGLEWFHRLLQDPGRLWKRYLIRDMPFFWLVLMQKFGRYRNPFADDDSKPDEQRIEH